MSIYVYQAKKGSDKLEGEIEASTQREALAKLDSLGLYPLSLEERKTLSKISSKVSLKEIAEFTHQLSTLINSGSSLHVSLNTLVLETEQQRFKPIILEIISQIKEGKEFSQALRKYPAVFSELYISLVKIGETSGTLGENLARMALFLDEELDFRANIISIMTYPILVMMVGIVTIFALLKFIIPKLKDIFEEIGQTLPMPTRILINISDIFSKYGIFILGAVILLVFVMNRYFKNPDARLKWDEFKLRIPLLGDTLKKIEICRLSRTLYILLKNGVPIESSLKILLTSVSNTLFKVNLSKIRDEIKEGFSLSEAMKRTGIFGSSFINVITVGEESGTLEKVLETLSYDYNREINRKIKSMMNLLEPFLILGVGLLVGFVVLSMLLPIFEIDFNF